MHWSKQVVLKQQSIKLFDSTKRGSKAVSTSSGSGGSGWWQEGSALTRAHPTLLSCSELLCSSTLVLTELSYWFKSHFTLLLCNLQQPAHQNWTPWTPYPLLIVCCTWAQPTLIMIEHFSLVPSYRMGRVYKWIWSLWVCLSVITSKMTIISARRLHRPL